MYLKLAISALSRLTSTRPAAAALFSIVVLLAAGTTGVQAQSCAAAPAGMVNWYPGNGTAQDIRGGENGTLKNGATYTSGEVGQAFSSNNTNGWVSAPAAANLQQITIAGWFRIKSYAGDYPTLFERGSSGTNRIGLTLINGTSGMIGILNGGNFAGFSADGALPLNQWVYVALTVSNNGSNKDITVYVNGSVVISVVNGTIAPSNNGTFAIGNTGTFQSNPINGDFDEVQVFNRGLTQSEVQSIYNAGSAGVCQPVPADNAANLVAWYAGDGDGRDNQGGQGLTFAGQQGVSYAVGKVGQAFSFPGGYLNGYAQTPVLNLGSNWTVELWFNPTDLQNGRVLLGNDNFANNGFGSLYFDYGPNLYYYQGSGNYRNLANGVVQAGVWTHIALTYDGSQTRMYINGVLNDVSAAHSETFNNAVRIGQNFNESGGDFNGLIDEPSFYNRALTDSEVQGIYNAGMAGKLKQAATYANAAPISEVRYGANSTESASDLLTLPRSRFGKIPLRSRKAESFGKIPAISAAPVSTLVGDATVTFSTVNSSGMTQEVPIDLSTMPPLPAGTATGLAYDISTSAVYSGSPTVCFNLPSLAGAFTLLRIYHLENGGWVDRTDPNSSSPGLCTTGLTSLSPFAIAKLSPTAAGVEISGRIRTAIGSGIRDVTVTLSGGSLSQPISTRTNSFGYYRLPDVPAGATYIISVRSKRYTFSAPTKAITLTDSVSAFDFVAESLR